jgi:hypothetical protein
MGMVKIELVGSFGELNHHASFSAQESGHAVAIGKAIKHLAGFLPQATKLDHKLQADRAFPDDNFGLPRGGPSDA